MVRRKLYLFLQTDGWKCLHALTRALLFACGAIAAVRYRTPGRRARNPAQSAWSCRLQQAITTAVVTAKVSLLPQQGALLSSSYLPTVIKHSHLSFQCCCSLIDIWWREISVKITVKEDGREVNSNDGKLVPEWGWGTLHLEWRRVECRGKGHKQREKRQGGRNKIIQIRGK
jgi:hypothetical protein